MAPARPVPDCERAADWALACGELSQPAKKNVLSLKMRPPALAPNWFCRLMPRAGLKNGRAFSTVFRKYSYRLPCKPFVPARVVTLMIDPELRPYSELYRLVSTFSSLRNSMLGVPSP